MNNSRRYVLPVRIALFFFSPWRNFLHTNPFIQGTISGFEDNSRRSSCGVGGEIEPTPVVRKIDDVIRKALYYVFLCSVINILYIRWTEPLKMVPRIEPENNDLYKSLRRILHTEII